MIQPISLLLRLGAASGQRLRHAMNVILHIGAHRCATTSFQHYLRHNAARLEERGIGFWGPRRTRNGLFSGVLPGTVAVGGGDPARRAAGRIRLACARSQLRGNNTLIVSDENILGSLRENLSRGTLYPNAGDRVARYVAAFGGAISDIVINIRAQDHYWSSALGQAATRGINPPSPRRLRALPADQRNWRDVIHDVARAADRARVQVFPFDAFSGQPEAQLALMTGIAPPMTEARAWLNRSPARHELSEYLGGAALRPTAGRWMPFTPGEVGTLREAYSDDIMWLTAGADGHATLMKNQTPLRTGQTGPGTDRTRGRPDDRQDRRVAQTR